MFTNQKIAFIGPGVMAEGIISALIRTGIAQPGSLLAAGPRQERGEELCKRYDITFTTDNAEASRQADVVVLSVKPQRLDRVMAGLKDNLQPQALVLSIVAGASIAKLSHGLSHARVVRSMPNTPGQ